MIERNITRQVNLKAQFDLFEEFITATAEKYGISEDEVAETFQNCNCDQGACINYLRDQSFTIWTELEDLALRHQKPQEMHFFVKTRTIPEVKRRMDFLGIPAKRPLDTYIESVNWIQRETKKNISWIKLW